MRKHDTPWLSETLPYEERVHPDLLGAAAVRAENERVASALAQDALLVDSDATPDAGLIRLGRTRTAAIDAFRSAVDELDLDQRGRFDSFMDKSVPPVLDYMRDATTRRYSRERAEDERALSWSEWLSTKYLWSAEEGQVLNVLQWLYYAIGEVRSSPVFKAIERDAKQRTNESLHEWHRLGYVTIPPRPERIERANVVLGSIVPVTPKEQLGIWGQYHPDTIVLAPGSGRTAEERLHSMQKDNELRHVLLHELGHFSFWGLGKYWFIREALNEFRTMLMEREPKAAKQELDSHELLLSDESDGYPTVRELTHVLLTCGRKVISMQTALRADTALPDSGDVEVLEGELAESWGRSNVLSAIDRLIHEHTEQSLKRLVNDPRRKGPKGPTADERLRVENLSALFVSSTLRETGYWPASM